MKSSLRTRSARATAAGALSVALLTSGAAGAVAATYPSPSGSKPVSPAPNLSTAPSAQTMSSGMPMTSDVPKTASSAPAMPKASRSSAPVRPKAAKTASSMPTAKPKKTLPAMPMPNGSMTAAPSAMPPMKSQGKGSPNENVVKATADSISITPNRTTIKAGDTVTFTGRTKGLRIGSTVVLERYNGKNWVALKATTVVKKGSSYSLHTTLTTKGATKLRVTVGKTVSAPVTVTVQ